METKLLAKYSESTLEAFQAETNRHCGGKPSTPWLELWKAQDECPKTIYYLDHIDALRDGEVAGTVRLLSDEELNAKSKRKSKPKVKPVEVCPHCGKSLKIAA